MGLIYFLVGRNVEIIQEMGMDWSNYYQPLNTYKLRLFIVTQDTSSNGGRVISYFTKQNTTIIAEFTSLTPSCDKVLQLILNYLYCCHYIQNICDEVYKYNMEKATTANSQVHGVVTIAPDLHHADDRIKLTDQYEWPIRLRGTISSILEGSFDAWSQTSLGSITTHCKESHNQIQSIDLESSHTLFSDNNLLVLRLDGTDALTVKLCDTSSEVQMAQVPPWIQLDIDAQFDFKGWKMISAIVDDIDTIPEILTLTVQKKSNDDHVLVLRYEWGESIVQSN